MHWGPTGMSPRDPLGRGPPAPTEPAGRGRGSFSSQPGSKCRVQGKGWAKARPPLGPSLEAGLSRVQVWALHRRLWAWWGGGRVDEAPSTAPTERGCRSHVLARPTRPPPGSPPTRSLSPYIIYNIGLSLSPFSLLNSVSLFPETKLHNFFSQCKWGWTRACLPGARLLGVQRRARGGGQGGER